MEAMLLLCRRRAGVSASSMPVEAMLLLCRRRAGMSASSMSSPMLMAFERRRAFCRTLCGSSSLCTLTPPSNLILINASWYMAHPFLRPGLPASCFDTSALSHQALQPGHSCISLEELTHFALRRGRRLSSMPSMLIFAEGRTGRGSNSKLPPQLRQTRSNPATGGGDSEGGRLVGFCDGDFGRFGIRGVVLSTGGGVSARAVASLAAETWRRRRRQSETGMLE